MPNTVQDYIAAFRRGEGFTKPATGLTAAGQPDPTALRLLGAELAVADAQARENIVALLVDVGLRTDPLTPQGAEVLRHPGILALLAGPGLAKADLGREAALDALRKLARPADLAPFGAALIAALRDAPSDEAFLLVAKAKPSGAAAPVDALALAAPWQSHLSAKIARATFGATDVEDGFLAAADAAEAAGDGRALAHALGTLALVGTPRSLRAIAERLRTPLLITIPNAMEKSVRLNVLDALRYNFPDQPVLYPNNVVNAASYAAAERFCSNALGVSYSGTPPPFLTYRAFPIPVGPQ